MEDTLKKKIALVLLFCRLAVVIVILVWTIDKLIRPYHGVAIANRFYGLGGLSTSFVFATGIFHLIAIAAYVFGFFKRLVSLYMIAICILPLFTPRLLSGFWRAIVEHPHPTINTYGTFAISACAFAVYYLRDYDTILTVGKKNK